MSVYISNHMNMKNLYALLITLLPVGLFGQTSHEIEVFSFGFDPMQLTIQAGDTVVWTNTGGSHNVNGTIETFPENPEGFGNEVGDAPWTYSHIFTIEGTYDYQCNPHAGIMQGTIIVEGNVSSTSNLTSKSVSVYPSPAANTVRIEGLDSDDNIIFDVFDITGKRAMQSNLPAGSEIDVSDLSGGLYIYNISTRDGNQITGKLLKE